MKKWMPIIISLPMLIIYMLILGLMGKFSANIIWIFTILSVMGSYAIAYAYRWGQVAFLIANIGWFAYNLHFGQVEQAAIFLMFIPSNILALIEWTKLKKSQGSI